jgi:hypothetical protein
MKERKPDIDRKEVTKEMSKEEQVAISRLRTGHTKATHGLKMEGVGNSLCPFLQHSSIRRPHTVGMQRNWGPENEHGHEKRILGSTRKKGMEKIIDYAKEIGQQRNIGIEKTTGKTTAKR